MCRSSAARGTADMDIAFSTGRAGCIAEVFCVRARADLDVRRRDIRRVQDTDALPFKYDLVRRHTVTRTIDETDDLCLCRIRCGSRRRIDDGAFLRGQRRASCHSPTDGIDINCARRHIEIANIDASRLTKDNTVRIRDIDIVAACNRAIDARRNLARDDIEVIVRLRAAVKHYGFAAFDGEILPADNIVRIVAFDCRCRTNINRRTACTHTLIIQRRRPVRRRGNAEEAGKETEADLTSQGVLLAHSSHFSSSFLSQEKPPQDVVAFFPSRLLPRQVIEAAKATCILLITAAGSARRSTTDLPVRASPAPSA